MDQNNPLIHSLENQPDQAVDFNSPPPDQAADSPPPPPPDPILHQLHDSPSFKDKLIKGAGFAAVFLAFYFIGLGSYWLINNKTNINLGGLSENKTSTATTKTAANSKYKKGQVIGIDDPTFGDTAEGLLEANDDPTKPGTHKLIRGDQSQTAYLTSSVVDLDEFVGRKVKIWGETQTAQEVGWFMDVGKVQILE
ncbi:MAG: hypothetical protein GXP43_02990 [bacterium]|nr:hypothetical protein [bacterium]